MRRIVLSIALGLGALSLVAAPAVAGGQNYEEESDGCDHGETGKDCRPDPSEHGKDCEVHGNHGGVNEDHCEETTTTTLPPTTTTTLPPTTTTTSSPEVSVIPDIPALVPEAPTTIVPDSPSTPGTACTTPDGYPYTTSYPNCPTTPGATVKGVTELPHTGSTVLPILFVGILLTVLGVALRRAVRMNRIS